MADPADDLKELVVRYPRMQDAVRMALGDALRASKDGNEWGGGIFQRGDQFYATKPQSSGAGRDLAIRAVADAVGDHAAAIYHTHPNVQTAERFSRADTDFAKAFGRPSYITSEYGDIKVFDPKVDKADYVSPNQRSDDTKGGAAGRIYLKKDLLAQALRLAAN